LRFINQNKSFKHNAKRVIKNTVSSRSKYLDKGNLCNALIEQSLGDEALEMILEDTFANEIF
jgi:hypothetical protein